MQTPSSEPAASVDEDAGAFVNEGRVIPAGSLTGSKRISSVWDHFKGYDQILQVKDDKGNMVDVIEKRAHCI